MRYVLIENVNGRINILGKFSRKEDIVKNDHEIIIKTRNFSHFRDSIARFNGDFVSVHGNGPVQTIKRTAEAPRAVVNRRKRKPAEKWDFSKLSQLDKDRLIAYYKKENWSKVFTIHNDNELTSDYYCCDSYIGRCKENIERGIKEGLF